MGRSASRQLLALVPPDLHLAGAPDQPSEPVQTALAGSDPPPWTDLPQGFALPPEAALPQEARLRGCGQTGRAAVAEAHSN